MNARRAAAIGTEARDDGLGGKFRGGIQSLDLGVIPFRDLTKKDVRQNFRSHLDGRGYAGNVVSDDHGAQGRGHVHDCTFDLLDFIVLHRVIGGAKVSGSRDELAYPPDPMDW